MTIVMLQIVTSLTDDSRGIIYDPNMFIVHSTGVWVVNVKNVFATDGGTK